MSIQEVSSIKSVTDYVIQNMNSESKQKADNIKSLFTERFYNGSNSSAANIASEITRLEGYLGQKTEEYNKTYAYLKWQNEELNILNQELQRQILEVTRQAEADERKQKRAIELAIDETNQMYMAGEIERSEMPNELTKRIARYYNMDPAILTASTRLNSVKSQISSLTNSIADIIDQVNNLETESKLVQGTLVMMRNLMTKMNLGSSDNSTAANERPIYTPTKQALVDVLAQGIKGLEKTDGEYIPFRETHAQGLEPADQCSMANPQLVALKNFLGMNGNGTLNKDGVLESSLLNQMKDAGFTAKEAVYAINWIFDKCNMSYTPGGQWSVPNGHGQGAHDTYATLLDQFDKLWGVDALRTDDNIDPENGGNNNPENPENPEEPVKRTDPIGFANGDTTYEFVIDRNNDLKFNGASEFLGASKGIDELKALDTDGNGVISKEEMESNEQLFVLMTDHNTGAHSFLAIAEAGINSIDLKSLKSSDWTNINENQLKNTFTVNTANGGSVKGYQTLDNDFYLKKSYNGVENAEMTVTVDDTAIQQAENIFSSIKTLSAEEYGEIARKAATSVKDTQRNVNEISQDMSQNALHAADGLTDAEKPQTAEEKAADEKKADDEKKNEDEKKPQDKQ